MGKGRKDQQQGEGKTRKFLVRGSLAPKLQFENLSSRKPNRTHCEETIKMLYLLPQQTSILLPFFSSFPSFSSLISLSSPFTSHVGEYTPLHSRVSKLRWVTDRDWGEKIQQFKQNIYPCSFPTITIILENMNFSFRHTFDQLSQYTNYALYHIEFHINSLKS